MPAGNHPAGKVTGSVMRFVRMEMLRSQKGILVAALNFKFFVNLTYSKWTPIKCSKLAKFAHKPLTLAL